MISLKFFKKNRYLLIYGVFLAFLSSFGQTFLIALYVPSIQETFLLSDTEFSSIYAGATLLSALLLTWLGRFIDKINIIKFTILVILGLCAMMLLFSQHYFLPLLFFSIFGLRLFGQGLLTHTSITAMARFFDKGRGKSISIASLGHPLGEMILPILIVTLIYTVGWKNTLFLSVLLVLICLPMVIYLLRHNTNFSQLRHYVPQQFTKAESTQTKPIKIIKSKPFWLIMPSSLVAASIGTGFLLFKLKLGLANNWSPTFVAAGFIAYPIGSALANLAGGFLADFYTGKKMFVFYLLPIMIGFMCLYFSNHEWVYIVLVASIGMTNGFGSTVKNMALTEFYGSKIIGSVRSLFITIMVFSTALGPLLFGFLLDAGFSFGQIAGFSFIISLLATLNTLRILRA